MASFVGVSYYSVFMIAVELAGTMLSVLGLALAFSFRRTIDPGGRRYFLLFFSLLLADTILNIVMELARWSKGMNTFYNTTVFFHMLLSPILAYVVTFYLFDTVDPLRNNRTIRICTAFFMGLHVLLCILSLRFGLYFYLTSEGIFVMGPLYFLFAIWSIVPLVIEAVVLILNNNRLNKRERQAFWISCIVPAGAAVFTIFGDKRTIIFALIIAGLFMFFLIMDSQVSKIIRQETEAEKLRTSMMISQIQPHFLYNALGAIYGICDKNPKMAKEAINDFSDYLRNNIASLKRTTNVSFEEEIKHVKTYLKIEKLSLREYLDYSFDCDVCGFMLPAFSVQLLVENAVKHGISKKVQGGRVEISSYEEDACFIVRISDNGVGFDPSEISEDDGRHIGISNVRERLSVMCNGKLTIESTVGEGTTAVIRIPKA